MMPLSANCSRPKLTSHYSPRQIPERTLAALSLQSPSPLSSATVVHVPVISHTNCCSGLLGDFRSWPATVCTLSSSQRGPFITCQSIPFCEPHPSLPPPEASHLILCKSQVVTMTFNGIPLPPCLIGLTFSHSTPSPTLSWCPGLLLFPEYMEQGLWTCCYLCLEWGPPDCPWPNSFHFAFCSDVTFSLAFLLKSQVSFFSHFLIPLPCPVGLLLSGSSKRM